MKGKVFLCPSKRKLLEGLCDIFHSGLVQDRHYLEGFLHFHHRNLERRTEPRKSKMKDVRKGKADGKPEGRKGGRYAGTAEIS